MDLLGNVVKRALKLRKTLHKVRRSASPESMQRKTLIKLLRKARQTEFGSYYGFEVYWLRKTHCVRFKKECLL